MNLFKKIFIGGLLPQSTTTETTGTTETTEATETTGTTETTEAIVNPKSQVGWTHYNLHGRIVNGTKAALRQFPYQVCVVFLQDVFVSRMFSCSIYQSILCIATMRFVEQVNYFLENVFRRYL